MSEAEAIAGLPGASPQLGEARRWIATPHIRPDFRGPAGRPFARFPDPAEAPPMFELLKAVSGERPTAIAFEDDSRSLDFTQFENEARRLGAAIQACAGDGPVAILLPTAADFAVAVFACLAAGRVCLLLDDSFPDAHNGAIASDAGASLLVRGATCPPTGLRELPFLDISNIPGQVLGSSSELPADMDAPAFLLATSGSEGEPKLVAHSQRTMLHWVRTLHDAMHIGPDDRVMSVSSPASLGGFTSLLAFPLSGAASQMFGIRTAGLGGLFATLRDRPVTILRAAPSMLRILSQHPDLANPALAGLRIVQTYGEPLLKSDVADLRAMLPLDCLIRTTYGSTEASGLSWYAGDPDDHDPVRVATGALMPDTRATIVGESGLPCAPGESGELLISSRYNALGDWRNGHLDSSRFETDRAEPGARIFRTGDIARCSSDGVFVVLGRKDRMVKINGQRVDPTFVEAVLRRLDRISSAEVAVQFQNGKAKLVAFVVADEAEDGEDSDLVQRVRRGLAASLPAFMVPSRIHPVAAIPQLPGGKPDHAALLALLEAG